MDTILDPPEALYSFPPVVEAGLEALTMNGDAIQPAQYITENWKDAPKKTPLNNPILNKKLQKWYVDRLYAAGGDHNPTAASTNAVGGGSATNGSSGSAGNCQNANTAVEESGKRVISGSTSATRLGAPAAPNNASILVYQNKMFRSGNMSDSGSSSSSSSSSSDSETNKGSEVNKEKSKDEQQQQVASSGDSTGYGSDTGGPRMPSTLLFDGEFEGGNISKVQRVFGRRNPPSYYTAGKNTINMQESVGGGIPSSSSSSGISSTSSSSGSGSGSKSSGTIVHQDYDITIRKDIYTVGNIQWFLFNVSTDSGMKLACKDGIPVGGENTKSSGELEFPLTVRFNIINMLKKDSLYNYGMKIATYSHINASSVAAAASTTTSQKAGGTTADATFSKKLLSTLGLRQTDGESHNNNEDDDVNNTRSAAVTGNSPGKGWYHAGDNICYYANGQSILRRNRHHMRKSGRKQEFNNSNNNNSVGTGGGDTGLPQQHQQQTSSINSGQPQSDKGKRRPLYTLTFTYTFDHPDSVYFAYCFPYTFTDLQLYLQKLENDTCKRSILRRQKLCETLAGNRCDLLTICEPISIPEQAAGIVRPAIVVTARVHPGETNASYAMHGFLEFITSQDDEQAYLLRKTFVFKVIPMLNPDGVIHGNNRCSLAGTDLNRRYLDAHPYFHPTIHATKLLLKTLQEGRGVYLYIDLHGHSRKKNSFVYGCDFTAQSEKYMNALPHYSKEEYDCRRIYPRIFPRLLCTLSNANAHCVETSSSPTRASAVQTNRSTPGASAGAEAATGEATHNSGYFSWKDCCFLIHRSKGGTGRVVGWRKFLVENSFTIELSFCSNGNNTEASLIKQYMGLSSFLIRHANTFNNNNNNHFGNSNDHNKQNGSQPQPQQQQQQQQIVHDLDNSEAVEELLTMINSVNQSRFSSWSAAASSNSNIANYRRGSRSSGREMAPQVLIDELRKLLQCCYNSNNCYHYTVQDYLNIGEHIGVAMYHYANLSAQNVEKMLGPVNKFNNVIPVAGAIKKDSAGNSDNAPISTASRSGGSSFAPNNPSIADGVEIREGHKVYIDNKNYQDGKRRNSTRNTRTQRSSSFSASSLFTGDDINDTSLEDRYAANMGNVSSEGEGTKSRSQSIGDSDNEASTTGTSLALGGVSSPTAGCKKNKKTAKKTESKRRGKRSEKLESTNIELIGSRMLDAPITSASVYAADAFRFAANKVFSSFPSLAQEQELGIDEHAGNGSGGMVCGGSGASLTTAPVNAMTDSSQMFPYEEVHRIAPYLPLRLQTEWKIRQALSITFDKDRNPNSSLNVSLDLEHEELENSGDGGGSDSEPSVDNVSLQKVLKCSKHTIKRNAKGKKSTKNKFAASMQSMMNKLKRKKHRDKHGDGGTDNTADETEDENKGGIAFNGGAPSSDARLATLLNNCAMGSARGSATGKSTSNNMPGGTKSQNHRYDDPPPNGAEKPPLFLHVKTLKLDGLPSYGDAIVPSFMPGKINSSPVTPAGRKSSFSSSALINNDSKQQTAMGFTGGNSSITGSEKMNDNLLHVLHSNRPASAKCSDSGSKKLLSASAVSGNYKLTRGNRYVPVKDATKSTADGALLPSSHTLSRRNQMQAPNSGAAQQATFGTTTLVYPATSSSAASSSNVGFGRPGSSRGMTTSQSMPDIGGGSAAEISGRQAVNNAVSNSALSRTESGIQQAAASAVAGRGERNNRVGGVSGRNNKEKLDQQDNKRVSETSRNASFGSVCGLQQSPQNQTMLHSSDMSRGPPEVAGPGNNVEQAELKQRENSLFQQQMSQQRALTSILSKPSSLSPHMAEYQQHQVAASIPMQRQSGSLGTSLPASTFQLNSTSTPMATAVSSGKMVLGNNGGRKESMLQHTSMRSPNNHGGVAGGTSPASMLQSTFCPASTQNVTSTKSTAIPAAALSSTTAAAFTSSGSGRVNGGALAYDFHTHHNNKINNGKVAPSVAAFASTGMMSNPSAALSPKMPHIANKLLSSGFAAADPTMVSPIRKKEAET